MMREVGWVGARYGQRLSPAPTVQERSPLLAAPPKACWGLCPEQGTAVG